jgi:hypothetical protein
MGEPIIPPLAEGQLAHRMISSHRVGRQKRPFPAGFSSFADLTTVTLPEIGLHLGEIAAAGTDTDLTGNPCRFKRSMQHYPMRSFDNASPEESRFYWAVLAQDLARAGSG